MALLLFIIIFILFVIIYYRRKLFLFSPVDFFIFYYLTCIILSFFYYYYWPTKQKVNFYNFDIISDKKFQIALLVFLRMVLFFIIGVLLFSKIKSGYKKISSIKINIINVKEISFDSSKLINVLVPLLIILTFMVFYDFGFEIFRRAKYIPEDKAFFKTFYQNLFFVVCIISGLVYKNHKMIAITSLLISLLLALSIGSRYATLYLIVFCVTHSFFLNARKRKLFFIFFIPFVFLFFGFNLSLRTSNEGHGLIPYFQSTIERPEKITKYTFENIYYSFIYGFFATADTISQYKNATISNLATCLSPLLGSMTRWPLIASKLRSNIYSPFTAIGEMSKFTITSFFYYIFIGYYFGFIDYFIKRNILVKKYFFSVIQLLFLSLFVVFSFEYNLRSSTRFIYYSIFFHLIYLLIMYIKKNIFINEKRSR